MNHARNSLFCITEESGLTDKRAYPKSRGSLTDISKYDAKSMEMSYQ